MRPDHPPPDLRCDALVLTSAAGCTGTRCWQFGLVLYSSLLLPAAEADRMNLRSCLAATAGPYPPLRRGRKREPRVGKGCRGKMQRKRLWCPNTRGLLFSSSFACISAVAKQCVIVSSLCSKRSFCGLKVVIRSHCNDAGNATLYERHQLHISMSSFVY